MMKNYKKKMFIASLFLTAVNISAQTYKGKVGINTTTPAATLDVTGDSGTPTSADGFIAPRLTGDELKAKDAVYTTAQTGTLVYATAPASPTTTKTVNVTAAGYYYFDGTLWQKVANPTAYVEPWYNQATNSPATTNTQNIYQMGNVGIGTTTPSYNLHVSNATTPTIAITNTSGSGTSSILVDSSSQLQIKNNSNSKIFLTSAPNMNFIMTKEGNYAISKNGSFLDPDNFAPGVNFNFSTNSAILFGNRFRRIRELSNSNGGQDLEIVNSNNNISDTGNKFGRIIFRAADPDPSEFDNGDAATGTYIPWLTIQNYSYNVTYGTEPKVGIGVVEAKEKLDVGGPVRIGSKYNLSGITDGSTTPVPTGGEGTMIYNTSNKHFYGWLGSVWKQLDNAGGSAGNLYTADGTLAGNRTVIQGANSLTFTSTTGNFIYNPSSTGNMGIGTSSPTSKLTVNGAATNLSAYNAGTSTTIDYSLSNLAYTTANPGNTFILNNLKDGGTYTLSVRGTTTGTAIFTGSGMTFKSTNNGATTAGKETVYTFLVMGSTVYYYMVSGF